MHTPQDPDDGCRLDLEEEVRLLKQAQQGNTEAYGVLYAMYAARVFRFIYAHMNHRQDAEDLTTEVFIRAWRRLPDYRHQGVSFSAFLFKIAYNLVIDCYRKQREEVGLPDDERIPVNLDHGLVIPAPGDDGDYLERERLFRMMWLLPVDYRTVLTARFLVDLSPEETAQLMGKSNGAIRVLQHRALAALKKLLS